MSQNKTASMAGGTQKPTPNPIQNTGFIVWPSTRSCDKKRHRVLQGGMLNYTLRDVNCCLGPKFDFSCEQVLNRTL